MVLTKMFTLTDFVLFAAASQGFFLAIALLFISNNNRRTNITLSTLLVMAAIMLIGRIIYARFDYAWIHQWSLLPDTFIFLFGPFSYLFVRKMIKINDDKKLPIVHFLPAGIFIAYFLYVVTIPQASYISYLIAGEYNFAFSLIEGLAIVLNLYYWFLSHKLLRALPPISGHIKEKPQLIKFLKYFLTTILISLACWTLSYIDSKFFFGLLPFINYDVIWVVIPLTIYLIGFYSLQQPQLFRVAIENLKSHLTSQLSEAEVERLNTLISRLIEKEKIYLKSDLTLGELSIQLQTSTTKLSWYLNNVQGTNFYDYINQFRIKEFLQRLERGDHVRHTILAIAYEVGFKSKSTFNKAFKIAVNDTPSSYIKNYQPAGLK